jgi:predicted TIM-barrel fold metal-dependent hydrolase
MPTMADMLAELRWTADRGFGGTMVPLGTARDDMPPLHDPYFDPFWSACEEYNFPLVCHAGYGQEQGEFMSKIDKLKENMEREGRDDLLNEIINNAPEIFQLDLRPRRAMWQMMLGGVFDRHPNLKLIMTEVRGDWLPATVKHLDAAYEKHHGDVIGTRKPSEYWQSNCLATLSFIHKAEVGMRHEIGLDTIAIGRDYPHAEGTWPNSRDWLNDVFQGVPDDDVRKMLGENAIRALGLDRNHLAGIAERIGLTLADITGRTPDLDPRMIANWDARGGYLKPVEQIDLVAIDRMLDKDFVLTAARR